MSVLAFGVLLSEDPGGPCDRKIPQILHPTVGALSSEILNSENLNKPLKFLWDPKTRSNPALRFWRLGGLALRRLRLPTLCSAAGDVFKGAQEPKQLTAKQGD